jgi:hypothetical protein
MLLATNYERTVLATNYGDRLASQLPDRASPLLPCSWETVQFAQSQVDLYTIAAVNASSRPKLKITMAIDPEIEVFIDRFGYPTVTFLSNIFGLVGLYLGYCFLDCYGLAEKMLLLAGIGLRRLLARVFLP